MQRAIKISTNKHFFLLIIDMINKWLIFENMVIRVVRSFLLVAVFPFRISNFILSVRSPGKVRAKILFEKQLLRCLCVRGYFCSFLSMWDELVPLMSVWPFFVSVTSAWWDHLFLLMHVCLSSSQPAICSNYLRRWIEIGRVPTPTRLFSSDLMINDDPDSSHISILWCPLNSLHHNHGPSKFSCNLYKRLLKILVSKKYIACKNLYIFWCTDSRFL